MSDTDGLAFFKDVLAGSIELKGCLAKPPADNCVLIGAMYYRAIELAEAISLEHSEGHMNVVPILCRVLTELSVDFIHAMSKPDYFFQMRFDELRGEIATEKALGNTEMVAVLERERDGVIGRGFKKLSIIRKFQLLGEPYASGYDTGYRSFCVESHNSSRSLSTAHLQQTESGWLLKDGVGMTEGRLDIVLVQSGRALCMMSSLVHIAFKTGKEAHFSEIKHRHGRCSTAN